VIQCFDSVGLATGRASVL